jgi:serine/threonine-protein kinase
MLTGSVPFTAPNPVDIILKHLHDEPPRPSEQRPDRNIDGQLEAIVLRCMAKDRAERFQSMDELLVELKKVRQRLAPLASVTPSSATPLSVTPLTTPPPPPVDAIEEVSARWPLTRRELIRYGAVAAAVVSVAATAAGALFAWNRAQRPSSAVAPVTVSAPSPATAATPASVAPAQAPQPTASSGIAAKVKQLLKPKQRPAQKEQPTRPSVGYRDDPYR